MSELFDALAELGIDPDEAAEAVAKVRAAVADAAMASACVCVPHYPPDHPNHVCTCGAYPQASTET